ncbi:hypothetical protein [Mixta gaviniae]|uniref:Uncharacterized protein n=1 Tax=Mixta gaviniae TaxID=665914 RepID=A0A1X1EBS6_9GAMM|nr:hypothetical protein [Mixta gaviniae]AUX95207.1 hypothetical protein C2E15_20575 [Mixta gaviniae]ORM86293.1 hypothetical protein HA44_03090 [Mixta gaviniae]
MFFQNFIDGVRRLGVKGCLLTVALLLLPFIVMSYWSNLSRQVYLTDPGSPFRVAAICGLTGALPIACAGWLFRRSRFTGQKLLKLFGTSAFMIAIFSLQIPSALVRYLPHQRLQYRTEFTVSFPGPSHGKSSRCEMGLWIKDQHLQRWIEFCSSKAWMDAHHQRGMDRIEVVEEVNQYGVRVLDYWFSWSPINETVR